MEQAQAATAASVTQLESRTEILEGRMKTAVLNPQIAKEREQERKILDLEREVSGMRTDLTDIKGLLLSMSGTAKK